MYVFILHPITLDQCDHSLIKFIALWYNYYSMTIIASLNLSFVHSTLSAIFSRF